MLVRDFMFLLFVFLPTNIMYNGGVVFSGGPEYDVT